MQEKDTGTWEKIRHTMVKFRGTRRCPGLTAGSVWKWKEKPRCFSKDRITFNDCDIVTPRRMTNLCFSVTFAEIHP